MNISNVLYLTAMRCVKLINPPSQHNTSTFYIPKCVTTARRLLKIRAINISLSSSQAAGEHHQCLSTFRSAGNGWQKNLESVQEYREIADEKAHPSACVSCYRKWREKRPTLCSHPVPVDKQLTSAHTKQRSFSICCVLLTLPVSKPAQSLVRQSNCRIL